MQHKQRLLRQSRRSKKSAIPLELKSCGAVYSRTPREEKAMHKDEVKGAGKEARGAVKDAVGKATGDRKLQADGKLDKAEGQVQREFGKAKESVRDALKR
jgi:uncharacterized protein YjbJ (UPF0337 family)